MIFLVVIFVPAGVMLVGMALLIVGYKLPRTTTICPRCEYDRRAHAPDAPCPECGVIPKEFDGGVIRDRQWARVAGWTLVWGPVAVGIFVTLFAMLPAGLDLFGL